MLFSHKTVEPVGVAGLTGNEFIVTVKLSEETELPQALMPITDILAIPVKVFAQSVTAEVVVPVMLPAVAG